MRTIYDVAVVGAGPSGRALAHRALAAGLRIAIVDPAPNRRWTATYGVYTDDLPHWFDRSVIAASEPSVTVFSPTERTVAHAYAILDTAALQNSLTIAKAHVHAASAREITATEVRCDDGVLLVARHVVDARGARTADHSTRPRQTAVGAVDASDDTTMVLMDWRPAASTDSAPSFSYRVALGAGRRLIEETCLAGAPPIDTDTLADRNRARGGHARTDEVVDFPLLTDPTPWRRPQGAPLRFGAAGGLMNPATGYSVGQSLNAVDVVVAAIADGTDPHAALWTRRSRLAYRLRASGLHVLLALSGDDLVAFFDAFFRIDPILQRRYLCERDDAGGVLRAMAAVFALLTPRLRIRVARSVSLRASP